MKASVFIDVQNDFVTGSLANKEAQEAIPMILSYARSCAKDPNVQIYTTHDTHDRDDYPKSLEGQKLPVLHCIMYTPGWMLVDGLLESIRIARPKNLDKYTFGCDNLAKELAYDAITGDISEIEICGLRTDVCVVSNALMIRSACPDTKITVWQNLCAGTTPENHAAALRVMRSCQIEIADYAETESA